MAAAETHPSVTRTLVPAPRRKSWQVRQLRKEYIQTHFLAQQVLDAVPEAERNRRQRFYTRLLSHLDCQGRRAVSAHRFRLFRLIKD